MHRPGVKPTGLLRVLESPWIFFQIFKAWKVLVNRHGPWKSLNLCLKVLESPWICVWRSLKVLESVSEGPWKCLIWFSKMWTNQLILTNKGVPARFFLTSNVHKIRFQPWLCPGPHWGSLWRLYMLIKLPVWFNLVFLIYPSYGPWKSLKSPWIWFWQMGKNPEPTIESNVLTVAAPSHPETYGITAGETDIVLQHANS